MENSMSMADRIKVLLEFLSNNLYGKEEVIRLALLSSIAGESIFLMGPPGTAKSMVSRRIVKAFKDIDDEKDYFEYLMNEFSTPDEICGPVSLTQLNEDKYVRLTEGYLPKAKIAFLDEIWKSGPAILNTLLTLINEKKFHNGGKVEKVPLVSLLSASNELPLKNAGLEALWDRFILRVFVNPVQTEEDFFKVVDSKENDLNLNETVENALLSVTEIEQWQKLIDDITLSEEAKKVITGIRKELILKNKDSNHQGEEAYYISDRRWKKIVHILKTSAFLNGRTQVDLMDCSLISYSIWNTENQYKETDRIVEKIILQDGLDFDITDIKADFEECKKKLEVDLFDEVQDSERPEIKNIDGEDCFVCEHDNEILYIGVGKKEFHDYHNIYDANQKFYKSEEFNNIDSDKLYGKYTEYKKIILPPGTHLEEKELTEEMRPELFNNLNENFFNPLYQNILARQQEFEEYRNKNFKIYEENIFARKLFFNSISEKYDEYVKSLEDIKLQLDIQVNFARKTLKLDEEKKEFCAELPGDLILVEGGYFFRGEEKIKTTVNSFYACKYAVSNEKYYTVMGMAFPSNDDADENEKWKKLPVIYMSWNDAVKFCNKLSKSEGLEPCYYGSDFICDLSKNGYRLLTEAEWEFAALSGNLRKVPGAYNYNCNHGYSNRKLWAVDQTENDLGLCNMLGNVWEYVNDIYNSHVCGGNNPLGPLHGEFKVTKGGSLDTFVDKCTVEIRDYTRKDSNNDSYTGFRIGRSAL